MKQTDVNNSVLSKPSIVENISQFLALISLITFVIFILFFIVDLIEWGIQEPPFGRKIHYEPLDYNWLILSISCAGISFNFFVIKKILEYLRGILFFNYKD